MTNEELVIRIQSGEDVGNNMALLYGQVKNFIRSIAWQYRDSGEMEDLEQEGYLTLYPAIDNFDPDAGCKFLTYAAPWIRQAMRRYLQNSGGCVRLPVHCLEQIQKMQKYQAEYYRKHGCDASDAEICRFMGLTLEQGRGTSGKRLYDESAKSGSTCNRARWFRGCHSGRTGCIC